MDLEYYKNNEIPLEEMKEDINNGIKLIQESFKSEISLNTYIQIEDKIISFTSSYIELLKEMIKANIIPLKEFTVYEIKNLSQTYYYIFAILKFFVESHLLNLFLCLK
jgi:hypothetical protein